MSDNQDRKDSDTESEKSWPRQWLPSGGMGRGVTVESPSGEDDWQVVDKVGGTDEEESEEEGERAADEGGANEEGEERVKVIATPTMRMQRSSMMK